MGRKYTHIMQIEDKILNLHKEGKKRREIAEALGLTLKQKRIGQTGITSDRLKALQFRIGRASTEKTNHQGA